MELVDSMDARNDESVNEVELEIEVQDESEVLGGQGHGVDDGWREG